MLLCESHLSPSEVPCTQGGSHSTSNLREYRGLKVWFSFLPKSKSIRQSDNGSHFIAGVVQEWAIEEGIHWVFHTLYYPQAKRTVERTNGLLKWFLRPWDSGWPD